MRIPDRGRPGHRRAGRPWPVALLAVIMLVAGLQAPAAAALAQPSTHPTAPAGATPDRVLPMATDVPPGVHVRIDHVTPAVLEPGQDLTVQVTISNGTTQELQGLGATLRLNHSLVISRSALDAWLADGTAGTVLATQDGPAPLPDTLPAGATQSLTLTVPAAAIGLPGNAASWGTRGLLVDLHGSTDGGPGTTLDTARTALVWLPGTPFTPTSLSTLVPVTSATTPDPSTGLVSPADLAAEAGEEGRLGRLVEVAGSEPLDVALDPAVVASAEQAARTPATAPTLDPWLEQLQTVVSHRPVVSLPFADPDVTALARSGDTDLIDDGSAGLTAGRDLPATTHPTSSAAATPSPGASAPPGITGTVDAAIAWPPDGLADQATLAALGTGGRTVIVSSASLPAQGSLTYTPDARTAQTVRGRTVQLAVADQHLSNLLGELGTPAGTATTPGATIQQLLADTAIIARERPAQQRHVLMTAPRDWDPDPAAVTALYDTLRQAPWLTLDPLTTLVESTPRTGTYQAARLPEEAQRARLRADTLHRLGTDLAAVRRIAGATEDPSGFVGRQQRITQALTSVVWRGRRDAWQAAADARHRQVERLLGAVSIVQGSAVNLIADRSDLPVTVTNDSAQPLRVVVHATARSPQLSVTDPEAVTVAPRSRTRVLVPVEAVANGQARLDLSLSTPDGVPIGRGTSLTVRVRANWETVGTGVLGGMVALLFVAGIVRRVRRGRVRLSPEELAAATQKSTERTGATTRVIAEGRVGPRHHRPGGPHPEAPPGPDDPPTTETATLEAAPRTEATDG